MFSRPEIREKTFFKHPEKFPVTFRSYFDNILLRMKYPTEPFLNNNKKNT